MIITSFHEINDQDVTAYAWHRLRLYRNPEFACDQLVHLHSLGKSHEKNALRQAHEIRACLIQADEYFASAARATLATRPLLLYYGLMSLALAEVLLKKTADHRLARMRSDNPAHGLKLVTDGDIGPKAPLQAICERLQAYPQMRAAGHRYGTFEVWRTEVREAPVPVLATIRYAGAGESTGVRTIAVGADARLPAADKYTFLDALRALPQMRSLLGHLGLAPRTVRATLKLEYGPNDAGRFTFIVHPEIADALAAFYDNITFAPEAVNTWEFLEMPSGMIINRNLVGTSEVKEWFSLPPAVPLNRSLTCFAPAEWKLGEFGSYYVGLHICGNLARYYPDIWMQHVERSTSLSLLVEQLCELALRRAPVLTASELDRVYYLAG